MEAGKCLHCGADLPAGVAICPRCGEPVPDKQIIQHERERPQPIPPPQTLNPTLTLKEPAMRPVTIQPSRTEQLHLAPPDIERDRQDVELLNQALAERVRTQVKRPARTNTGVRAANMPAPAGLAKFIFVERAAGNRFAIRYPSIQFPDRCVKCGQKPSAFDEVRLSAGKIVGTSYSAPTTRTTSVVASMDFRVPLCAKDWTELEAHEQAGEKERRKLIRSVVISGALGALLMAVYFLGIDHSPLVGGAIFLSILFGAPLGVFILWPLLFYLLPMLVRWLRGQPVKEPNDPYVYPYSIYMQPDDNMISLRVIIRLHDPATREEFKRLNGVEEHLIEALGHKDVVVSCNAIRALALGNCQGAVEGLKKRLDDNRQVLGYSVSREAAKALKQLQNKE